MNDYPRGLPLVVPRYPDELKIKYRSERTIRCRQKKAVFVLASNDLSGKSDHQKHHNDIAEDRF